MNKTTDIVTKKIKLWGIVQGVGFRPFVAKMADRYHMRGEVLNIGGLVEITVTDTESRIRSFMDAIVSEKPGPSEIVHIKCTDLERRDFQRFEIIGSDEGDDEAAMIPADLAICRHCLEELYDKSNPRYQHPFISCMACGPRYTIIDRIPYDRDNTSMIDFPMCDFCEKEYADLHDRRHHAQTISCHDCGPQLMWSEYPPSAAPIEEAPHGASVDGQILDRAAEILQGGGVIAFKSVGGYNLVADPFNETAIGRLREIKHRESKPFAVMFRSMEQIRDYCLADSVEEKLLRSSARPIILLEHRLEEFNDGSLWTCDLMRSRFIGSFLPSFAAQYMLLDRISPLVFTSANPSDMPMIMDDEEAFGFVDSAGGLISGILYNRRQIRVRADDSVTRVIDRQPQMIRRSKGYAPVPLYVNAGCSSAAGSIFAAGSQLKNSFALSKGPFSYMSQYFGDMDTVENQTVYAENITRMSELFRIKPELVVCDMHPLYFTTSFAEEYAKANRLPLLKVQHHHAHVASVMAENNLTGPVIGVSFDGTGYGTDGCIWGGEFLLCEEGEMRRMAHLKYVDMIGGDSSMKDGVRSALSYIAAFESEAALSGASGAAVSGCRGAASDHGNHVSSDSCKGNHMGSAAGSANPAGPVEIRPDISDIIEFGRDRILADPKAAVVLRAIESRINTVRSSSMGRLFDAVSCLLGICDYNDYEGRCAIMLEDAAAFAQKHPGEDPACDLALSFHERIIHMILRQCMEIRDKTGARQVALTGGTFQNRILMEGILDRLRSEGFRPYYNISVSPNDGGIALGQLYIAMCQR